MLGQAVKQFFIQFPAQWLHEFMYYAAA